MQKHPVIFLKVVDNIWSALLLLAHLYVVWFQLGGFFLPFVALGVLMLLSVIISACLLPQIEGTLHQTLSTSGKALVQKSNSSLYLRYILMFIAEVDNPRLCYASFVTNDVDYICSSLNVEKV